MKTPLEIPELRDFPALQNSVVRWYGFDSKSRRYHNLDHALSVVEGVRTLSSGPPSPHLVLAALWHDAVYIPGAKSGVNEEASAAALYHTYCSLMAPSFEALQVVSTAMTLIRGTSISDHFSRTRPRSADQRVLLDADLQSLSAPYASFLWNQRRIITENNGDPGELGPWLQVINFLDQLKSSRDHLYHTALAREIWEPRALFNIKCLIQSRRYRVSKRADAVHVP